MSFHSEARQKIVAGQRPFLENLERLLFSGSQYAANQTDSG